MPHVDQSESAIISHGRLGTEWLQFPESVNHQHQEYLETIMGTRGDTLGLINFTNPMIVYVVPPKDRMMVGEGNVKFRPDSAVAYNLYLGLFRKGLKNVGLSLA